MVDVCMIIGAGAGIGGHVGKRFAQDGYHVALCRRSDQDGLDRMFSEIEAAGGSASGHILNAADEGAIEQLIDEIEADIGPINVAVYNLGAQIGNRALADTPLKTFELGWRIGNLGVFRVAQKLFPLMVARGGGALLVTSATSAMRGNAGQHSHAAAMGGRRMLCQSLNAEFAAQNIHVAHILIDSAVNAPDTLGKLLGPERFAKLLESKAQGKDEIMEPSAIADTYFHVAHQHRSAWTFELDMRAFTDNAWWNHPLDI
ncbi:MAG: SDR family NAD(P)-dependent oxidoreductase [Parasphingorhabdus sp.]|uniref:SDR family NAD(P)-dependent oxidoreductase n=2 Tax=Parasphingorhabdus sp. TaxID=2709688 RepID=UPI003266F01A